MERVIKINGNKKCPGSWVQASRGRQRTRELANTFHIAEYKRPSPPENQRNRWFYLRSVYFKLAHLDWSVRLVWHSRHSDVFSLFYTWWVFTNWGISKIRNGGAQDELLQWTWVRKTGKANRQTNLGKLVFPVKTGNHNHNTSIWIVVRGSNSVPFF